MASKRQELETRIILSGKIDGTAKQISTWLNSIGSKAMDIGGQFQKIGNTLMQYEKLYADFDDSMRATQGKLVTATKQQMGELEEQVRSWAETTRFGAVETANAVKEAASSGWELTEIYEGIPTVMLLAQAASLDLTDATEYLNSALAGMNLEMSDSATLVDQWVMAANRSRASVSDLGEAMQRMGSLMTFTDSSDEILTLLSVMAEYGTKGSEAGTLLRNVMLRLIAPTKKAAETLDALDASEEELDDLATMDTEAASKAIETLGLNVYDAEGNLKSIIEIISELRKATAGMTEEEMYPTLAAIFPTRTLRGIMDLLRTTDEEYAAIQNRIRSSGGYAQQIAELQEGGVGGSMRSLKSAWEELRLTIGEAMTPHLIEAFDALAEAIRRISDMPDGVWQTIGNTLSTVVEAGPTLIGAGVTLKLLSQLFTARGAITVGLLTAVTLLRLLDDHIEAKREAALDALFGNVTLDVSEMVQAISQSSGALSEQEQALTDLKATLKSAGDTYTTQLTDMTQKLTQWSITGQELTEEQKTGLVDLGEQMIAQVGAGIEQSELYNMNVLDMLFGDPERTGEASAFSSAVLMQSDYYTGLKAEYEQVGQDLRKALTEALMDGEIDSNDREAIMEQIKRLNEIEQAIMEGKAEQEFGGVLYDAAHVSADTMEDFLKEADAAMQEELDANKQKYKGYAGQFYSAYKYAMDNAQSDAMREKIQADYDNQLSQLAIEEANGEALIKEKWHEPINRALDSVFSYMGQSDAWSLVKRIAEQDVPLGETDWTKALNGMNAGDAAKLLYALADEEEKNKHIGAWAADVAGMEKTYSVLALLDRYAGELENRQNMQELFGGIPTKGAMQNEKDIKKQGATDAQTYADAVQAELSKENIQLPVSLVGNGVQVGATNGGGSSGSKSGGLFSRIKSLFAEGGRATEASIFGEAGPEWAIPEAHTARTASLLKAAAAASGFTVAIGNAPSSASSGPATVIYSPVINANDARGVQSVLKEDKKNLEKWWNERAARAEAEAFG